MRYSIVNELFGSEDERELICDVRTSRHDINERWHCP